jgi:hypothetical protein
MARAAEILLNLPSVFTLSDFIRESGSQPAVAKNMLVRLARRTWVKNAGVRSTVYFNLLRDPRGADNRVLEAVKRMYPSAVVIGPACLHVHGWTTQIPQITDVAVLQSPTLKQFEGVNLVPRPRLWYADLIEREQLLREDASPFPIASATPAFALEDARRHQDVWVPDPDDLDIPESD